MTRRDVVHPAHLLALKVSFRRLVEAVGGLASAAEMTGKSESMLSAYGLPNTNVFAPVDAVRLLEDHVAGQPGWPQVTQVLARAQGFALVALPQGDVSEADLCRRVGEIMGQAGPLSQKMMAALSDGKVDGAERAAMQPGAQALAETSTALARLLGEAA